MADFRIGLQRGRRRSLTCFDGLLDGWGLRGESIPPILGIVDTPGQFHAWWFQSINVWVKEVAPGQYLYVWAGGQPVDATLEHSTATIAGVLVVTPKDQGPGAPIMSNGTRYAAPGSPTGKLKVTAVNGSVLTLQVIGSGTTYTFNTDTNTYG